MKKKSTGTERRRRARAKQAPRRSIVALSDYLRIAEAMSAVCLEAVETLRAHPDTKRRAKAMLVYMSGDERARSVAEAASRESKQPVLPAADPTRHDAFAFVWYHDTLVRELRRAGYSISDAEDPGPGRMATVFVLDGRCQRKTLVVEPGLAAQHDALMDDLDALPAEVLTACLHAVEQAVPMNEGQRRQGSAIVVCECNDAKAVEVVRALGRELGAIVEPEPNKAAAAIQPYADVVRIARGLGYEVKEVADPAVGWMRVLFFSGGRVIATTMETEHEADVARKESHEAEGAAADARRTFAEKEATIMKAVRHLLHTDPALLKRKIVVVFGSRTEAALAVYRELAAMPEQQAFPPELPPNASVISVTYEDFMQALHRQGAPAQGIDAATLGPNVVRVAFFTPGGVFFQKMETLGFVRGGLA